jgi:hypothetical protein
MPYDDKTPFLKRKTISLDCDRVVNNTEPTSSVRIIRARQRVAMNINDNQRKPFEVAREVVAQRGGCNVLVINASHAVAHEITAQLTENLPDSTILFAPTLSLALWILKRRSIDLILSTDHLPDGSLAKLHEFLELMSPPPELLILSDLTSTRSQMTSHPGYRFVEVRRISYRQETTPETAPLTRTISELGADLRNDLNNPLQEIVAMAFVAHASAGLSPVAEQALSAIQRAAGSMEAVVKNIEDKIRGVVSRTAA